MSPLQPPTQFIVVPITSYYDSFPVVHNCTLLVVSMSGVPSHDVEYDEMYNSHSHDV